MSHGTFCWYELMTTDTAGAEAFYRRVIGWDARDAGMPGIAYTLFSAGGTSAAGMMALPEEACAAGARPGWIGHVAVDDVDAGAAHVARTGGMVHRAPTDIPGVGRFAVVADPHGAVFCLFKPSPDYPGKPAPAGTPGHGGWRELHAGDRESDFAFYADLFGWTKGEGIDMGPMGIYQIFQVSGTMAGGMMTKTDAIPAPFWLYYFIVDAIDAAAARVTEAGGKILHGPQQVPGGSWILQCLDPQNVMFALVAPVR